jgi:hypothetical protein
MNKHKILILASLTFVVLLTLSILFYKERTCILDISYHLFYILKDGSFAIQNNRFGAFFTQLFPLIGSKLCLSLNSISVLYSMSFVILSFLTFLIIYIGLKNRKISTTYLLFVVLMTTHTFYWIQSELPQALAFLFILIALLDNAINSNKEMSPPFWLFVSILSLIVCFTHPLILIAFTFFILYYFISYPKQIKLIASIGLIYFSFYLFKSLFFKTIYDSQAIGGLNNFITYFPYYFHIQSNKNLFGYFIHDYYFLPLLLIASTIFYLKSKQYKKIILLLIFFIGYCLLVNVSYPNGAEQFYLENQYLILSFIVALPFVLDVLPKLKKPQVQFAILCLICLVGLFRIAGTHQIYTNRLDWNRNLLAKTKGLSNKKIIIPSHKVPIDTVFMTWGSSYEFWLLSSIENGVSRSIIIEEIQNEFDWAIPSNKTFITKWGTFNYEELNKKYFIFTDTTNYIKMQ